MPRKRRKMSQRLRYKILRRDCFTCRYCGAAAPHVQLHVDHITPVSRGGTDDPSNLCAACTACNLGKGDLSGRLAADWLDGYTDDMQFIYCDPYITSLYGEPVV